MSHRATIDPVDVDVDVARPTWSVMVPTFNCAGHLGEALSSVLAQAPGPDVMQIEVVDDASIDDPRAVVEEVGEGRVGFFRHPENVGHIRNFATCIRRSRGTYVHLLHGDDFVLPGFYTALQHGFESDPAVGAAFCRWMLVGSVGEQLSIVDARQREAGPLTDPLAQLASEQHIVTPSVAVRRSVYEQLGGFDDRLLCAEDWEMWVRIAAAYDVWYEPAVLAAYRTHANSNTGRHHRLAKELRYTAKAIDIFSDYLPGGRGRAISTSARRTYARTALGNARAFAEAGDAQAVRAHLRAALRLSRSPGVLIEMARLLPDAVAR